MGNYLPHLFINSQSGDEPAKRKLDKKEAVRHLIHAAVRMTAAKEDPFAIHMLVQSADKLLIDVSSSTGQKLAFNLDDYVKPELKKHVFKLLRLTYNFFKHADQKNEGDLEVGDIAKMNLLQLAVCVGNYKALYGDVTDHMQLIYAMSRLAFPDGFEIGEFKGAFDAEYDKIKHKCMSEFIGPDIWKPGVSIPGLPNLKKERDEDVKDNGRVYETPFAEFANK